MSNYPSEFSVRLRNFGSFIDSEQFTIRPGLNSFIGVNNAGKTALLFALASFSTSAKAKQLGYPYGNVWEFLKRYKRADIDPLMEIEFPITGRRNEILASLWGLKSQPTLPVPDRESLLFRWVLGNDDLGLVDIRSFEHEKGRVVESELLRLVNDPINSDEIKAVVADHPFGLTPPDGAVQLPAFDVTLLASRSDLRPFKFNKTPNQLSSLWPELFQSVVLLSTHRNPPTRGQLIHTIALDPVASNLPQVLATIQLTTPELENGRQLFDAIQNELKLLFPEFKSIRTEIVAERNPPEMEVKLDLTTGGSVPLSHSGTGVQQVLALLTGAFVSKEQSLFLLDEPHSYLHPAAERGLIKLLDRLGRDRGHYFCVATHSPIFASHNRKQLFAVRMNRDEGSKVRSLRNAADILDTIGISNPDLFTYSRVVFVEGPSDEKVVTAVSQLILDDAMEYRLKIQRLGGDGILKNRSRAEFIDLLCKTNAAEVHVPIRFVLDSNDWNDEVRNKLSSLRDSEGGQVIYFLKLQEIENYLLHEEAIVFALDQRLANRNMSHLKPDVVEIRKIIGSHYGEKGSDVLTAIFLQYECDYSKNKDVEHLLSFILSRAPQHLQPLIDELSTVVSTGEPNL